MGSFTAQILVGRPHPNHDGINPTHYLFLSENSRPSWVLVTGNILSSKSRERLRITWIPTLENMLEDALLMIAIHILKNENIIKLAESFNSKSCSNRFELYSDLTKEQRDALYVECKLIEHFPKIMISVFKGSHVKFNLPILEEYDMEVEVCSHTYTRLYSRWTDKTSITGKL
jgi:hypothetical protein